MRSGDCGSHCLLCRNPKLVGRYGQVVRTPGAAGFTATDFVAEYMSDAATGVGRRTIACHKASAHDRQWTLMVREYFHPDCASPWGGNRFAVRKGDSPPPSGRPNFKNDPARLTTRASVRRATRDPRPETSDARERISASR